ncbi:MAG: histidine phosphatase family protein, partial [Bdellovibrionales bacterium]|nr:histidine phosphatase family protein [Bdellovibrionales bacterium]
MNLVVIRHGIAEARASWNADGRLDEERPLSQHGKTRMALAAAGLATELPTLGVLVSSPLARARQTADILCHRFPDTDLHLSEALRPESCPEDIVTALHQPPLAGSEFI